MGSGKGGKGGGPSHERIYNPQHTSLLENMATAMAVGTAARQNPALAGLAGGQPFGTGAPAGAIPSSQWGISGGGGLSGARTPAGTPYAQPKVFGPSAGTGGAGGVAQYGIDIPNLYSRIGPSYQFTTPDIKDIPQQAYSTARDLGLQNIQKAQQRAGAQAVRDLGSRGVGRGGLASGQSAYLSRLALEQGSDLSRNLAVQQAQEQLATDKLLAQMGMTTQQRQAGENLARAGLGLQAGQADIRSAMLPFEMLSGLYGQNLSVPAYPTGGGGKGDPFSAILGTAGSLLPLASMATPLGPAALGAGAIGAGLGAACLPKGTEIELEDGSTKKVEDIEPGDEVKGGAVTAIQRRSRNEGHVFYRHKFVEGQEVVMSDGHPYHEVLVSKQPDDNDSKLTYDILTSSGHYFINGARIGSTMRGA